MQYDKKMAQKIFPIIIALGFIVVVFILFIKENNNRIVSQNASYLEDATLQTTQRVSDLLINAQDSINTIAYLYGQTMTSQEVDFDKLGELAENAPFDYIEFVDAQGVEQNADGRRADVSDRNYFQEGMKGNSGMDVVFDSRITEENLLVFYSPLRYKGKIIGVLIGHYREEQMQDMLDATFFGENTGAFLCLSDGAVIACSFDEGYPDNVIDYFRDKGLVTQKTAEEMTQAFADGKDCGITYREKNGTGVAYLSKLPQNDWLLFQTFPSSITVHMVENANAAGIALEVELILIFLVYIVVLVVLNWRQKKALFVENQEMSQVIDGITQLFDRFILVDFEKNTYRYLAGTVPQFGRIPLEGDYTVFADFLVSMIIGEDERERVGELLKKEYIQQMLDEDTPDLRYEYQIDRGEEMWENLNIICLKRVKGTAVSVLITRQDVTELKEEELRTHLLLKEAFQAAENASHAKSDFLSRMSHDIRTPMNAIMGMTAIAAMHLNEPDRVADCLEKINVSNRHLLGLINEVLDMSKIESGKVTLSEEEFNLSETVENLLSIFYSQIEKNRQQLNVNIATIQHENVIGDSQRLEQVFVNILGNAVKFTPEGGTISIDIRERKSRLEGYGCYEFAFTDTGIGMEESFLEHIFEPFAQAEDSRKGNIEGTGLGMPIARNIVRMMNGDIKVQSKLAEGSCFTVTIYLKLCSRETEYPAEMVGLTILVVDDEPSACENACEMLSSIGMVPDWALSGDEAIEKVVKAHREENDYAALILDWKMPGKDGVQTAREIKKAIDKDIPIIILSAYDWSTVEQEAREAGINAFIAKPLFKSRLLYVLKDLLVPASEEENEGGEFLLKGNYIGKRALLVEDNELNMEIAGELLESVGLTVDKAFDGKQAVEQLQAAPEGYYQLVFMDIQMPNMNGYEAARAIRSSKRDDLKKLPIIAMTADAFMEDVNKAKAAGMNAHIAKPIEIAQLAQILDDLEW